MKLVAMMLVRNEEHRYLKRVLSHLEKYVDKIVIVDDSSTDNTPEICESYAKARVIRLQEHGFENEWTLRQFCWEKTLEEEPDWILAIDADEIFEEEAVQEIRELIEIPDIDGYAFRLFDLWGSEEYYRDDELWNAHNNNNHLFLVRNKSLPYDWQRTPVHCGRIPYTIWQTHNIAFSSLRIKHYGWVNTEEHKGKFDRYMKTDSNGQYGSVRQYYSILDKSPNLVKWEE